MEVYALVGPSGTGKSHRALLVSHKYDIPLLIDDGLLIKGNKILAGKSAKRESNTIAAVRRAIFLDEEHAKEVRGTIESLADDKILIIGTSNKMVKRISKALGFEKIDHIIRIEDIASEEEIDTAREKRMKEGKHVIPVPIIEVKPKFSGYLMESLELILGMKNVTKAEKTIIRPRFSYYGKLLIHDNAVDQLIKHAINEHPDIIRLVHLDTEKSEEGIKVFISLECLYGRHLPTLGKEIQSKIKEILEETTGLNVLQVNLYFANIRLAK